MSKKSAWLKSVWYIIIFIIPTMPLLFLGAFRCFSTLLSSANKDYQGKLITPEFENYLQQASSNLGRLDNRLSSIIYYDAFLINRVSFSNETVFNASGTIVALDKVTKYPATLTCDVNGAKERFDFESKHQIVKNLPVSQIPDAIKSGYDRCTNLEFTHDPPPIPPLGTLSISSQGEICVLTRPTKISYLLAYAVLFALWVGALRILKEGFEIATHGLNYFVESQSMKNQRSLREEKGFLEYTVENCERALIELARLNAALQKSLGSTESTDLSHVGNLHRIIQDYLTVRVAGLFDGRTDVISLEKWFKNDPVYKAIKNEAIIQYLIKTRHNFVAHNNEQNVQGDYFPDTQKILQSNLAELLTRMKRLLNIV